jgi:phosphate transport system substrate-binding protein
MNKFFKLIFIFIVVFLVIRCNTKVDNKKSIPEENIGIVTDETLTPIIEDQIAVFESEHKAKVNLISKSEAGAINALMNNSVKVAILSRKLTTGEMKAFDNKKIIPKVTPFATDAIVLIRNSSNNDTLIALNDVLDFMKGKSVAGVKGLVFDNPNSSTVRYLTELAGLKDTPQQGVFSFNSNQEAIKYVAENNGMIGVVGLNWVVQPKPEMLESIKKIRVLSVKGINTDGYFSPTQNNLAEKKYPLARDLFVVNCQEYGGLGMDFALFVAGDRGQRIILKSGLLPVRVPGRKIVIRNKINK